MFKGSNNFKAYVSTIGAVIFIGLLYRYGLDAKSDEATLGTGVWAVGIFISTYLAKAQKPLNSKHEVKWPDMIAFALVTMVAAEKYNSVSFFTLLGLAAACYELGCLNQFLDDQRRKLVEIDYLRNDLETCLLKKKLKEQKIRYFITTIKETIIGEDDHKKTIYGRVYANPEDKTLVLNILRDLRE